MKNMMLRTVEIDRNSFAVELKNGNVSVNLTKMAKPFGKRVGNWLKTGDAKEFLIEAGAALKVVAADLLVVRSSGNPEKQGTWARDYRVALYFAQWLDKAFAFKVADLLFKLMTGELAVGDFVLPKLERVETLFESGNYYRYIDLLSACGLSTKSGNVRRRCRRNPQEFIKKDNVIYVSEYYGKTVAGNADMIRRNDRVRENRLDYDKKREVEN